MRLLTKSNKLKLSASLIRLLQGCGAGLILVLVLPNTFGQGHKIDKTCPANPDAQYERGKVFSELASILETSIPEYKKLIPAGFGVTDGRPRAFFVYDLSDPLNNRKNGWGCVNLIDRHIYHVSPFETMFSFSHIVILEDGKMKVFKSINCRDRGDSLEDVLAYLDKSLENNKEKTEILDRVRKYREFGKYSTVDDHTLRCYDVNSLIPQDCQKP